MKRIVRRAAAVVAVALAAASTGAHGIAFDQLVIFGDSFSDTGNNAIVVPPMFPALPSPTPVPVAGNTFIPTIPYASKHYTNAGVWAEAFAAKFEVSALASLLGGTNYAFGGATTGTPSPGAPVPTLQQQLGMFLFASGGTAPSEALYVVAGGGNNARETFGAAAPIVIGGGNPSAIIAAAASAFASDVKTIVQALMGAGATKIVVWNVPDPGLSPAVLATGSLAGLATTIAGAMNAGLVATLGDSGLLDDVMLFDLFGLVHEVVGNPGAFGLSNVGDACAALQACIDKNAAGYLFWDGVHPTSVGHAILANEMIAFVPEPDSLALLAVAVLVLGWVWARRKP